MSWTARVTESENLNLRGIVSMARLLKPTSPNTRYPGIPDWHHSGSSKLRVTDHSEAHQFMELVSGGSRVTVGKFAGPGKGWTIQYELTHGPHSHTKGQVLLSSAELAWAFALADDCTGQEVDQILLDMYGGDACKVGGYFRSGMHLNVPGPGHGYHGDPNLSILITEEMQRIVRKMLAAEAGL
jgi:hypothetical protein